jgi:hypothetical protein
MDKYQQQWENLQAIHLLRGKEKLKSQKKLSCIDAKPQETQQFLISFFGERNHC